MQQTRTAQATAPELNALGASAASPALCEGWRVFLGLPAAARADIFSVLGPLLERPTDPANNDRFKAFCQHHRLRPAEAAPAVEALNLLLRHASAVDLDPVGLEQDLLALSGGTPAPGSEVVLAHYPRAKTVLRNAALSATIADHGRLLTGIDWRVDEVSSSNHGLELSAPVVLLTLHYREGSKQDRITLQLLPETVQELKGVLARFVV